MNLKLDLNLKTILPVLRRLQPYVFGAILIGAFGYTAYVINGALNVKASDGAVAVKPLPKIGFDRKTIESLKGLNAVTGEVPLGDLGRDDPFR